MFGLEALPPLTILFIGVGGGFGVCLVTMLCFYFSCLARMCLCFASCGCKLCSRVTTRPRHLPTSS